MKRFAHLLIFLALAVPAFAQEPPPGITPEIKGPSLAAVGQELRLTVVGLTTPPLADGIGKLQEWSTKVNLLIDAPDGVVASADTDLSLGLGAQAVRFRIFFTPESGGTYVLVLHDANAGKVITKRIVVGPVVPQPDPPKPQPPTPTPAAGKRLVLLVREVRDVTPAMNLAELSLTSGDGLKYLRSKQHTLMILSDDRDPPKNLPPIALAAYQKAKGLTLPSIAILDQDSWAELFVGPVDKDASAEDILGIVKKYGG